jgi:hypothetical protein
LGLTQEEVVFYDALEVNDSAVKVLGTPEPREIAREAEIRTHARAPLAAPLQVSTGQAGGGDGNGPEAG